MKSHLLAPTTLLTSLTLTTMATLAPTTFQSSPPTYHQDIAPMFANNCMPCHTENGSAPFPLETYEQVKSRAKLVRFQLLARTMPPLHATTDLGQFSHISRLTDQDLITYQNWINANSPEGAPIKTNTSPTPPSHSTYNITVSANNLGAIKEEGPRYWQVIEIPLPKDLQNQAINSFTIQPQSPKAVRSALLAFSTQPPQKPYQTAGNLNVPGSQLIGTWAPGFSPFQLPQGAGISLRSAKSLVIQLLIQPTGKPDPLDFNLHIKSTPIQQNPTHLTFIKEDFTLPPNETPTFTFTQQLPQDQLFHSLIPIARFYAAEISLTATLPDQSTISLFHTNKWDPYWVGNYQAPSPKLLPKGTTLNAKFSYSNDERCAMNEGKEPTLVRSGNTIEEEVCQMHILLLPTD